MRELAVPPSLGMAKAAARAEMLAEGLSVATGDRVVATVASTYGELEERIASAAVDFAWCPSAVCARLSSVRALLTIARDGHDSYRSALIALRAQGQRPARSVASLAQSRIAWVDPLSAGGYLLVAALLRSRGIDPDKTFASQAFLGTHRAVALAVLEGEADVGAVSMHGFREDEIAAMLRWYVGPPAERLEAIAVTERCPNDALVVTSKIPLAVASTVTRAIEDDAKKSGSRVLAAFEADALVPGALDEYRRAFSSSFAPSLRSSLPVARTSRPPPKA